MKALLFIAAIFIVSFVTAGITQNKQPEKEYFMTAKKVPVGVYYSSLDSIDKAMLSFGKSMTVDQADQYRQFIYKQLNKIVGEFRLDSAEVQKPKK